MDEQSLAKIFHGLGAKDPEMWAHSQITEGIPQLTYFCLIKSILQLIVRDASWLDQALISEENDSYWEPIRIALQDLTSSGGKMEDIVTIVKHSQIELVSQILYLLDDYSSSVGAELDEDCCPRWGLFSLDKDDNPVEPLEGVHEFIDASDPDGKEYGIDESNSGDETEA